MKKFLYPSIFALGLIITPLWVLGDDSPAQTGSNGTNTQTQWKETGAQATYDGSVFVTGVVTVGKYIESIAISTPTAPATNHFRVFYSSTSDQWCGVDSTGTVACMGSTSSSVTTVSSSTLTNTAESFPSSGVAGDMLSITLTAGTWEILTQGYQLRNGATSNAWDMYILTVAGNSTSGNQTGVTQLEQLGSTANADTCLSMHLIKVVSSNTTYYLKVVGAYSVATPGFFGIIAAHKL